MPLRKIILVLAVVALSLLAGCKKKKPNVPPPQAPTITAPAPESVPLQTQIPPETPPPAPPPATTTTKPKPKPHSTHPAASSATKKTTPPAAVPQTKPATSTQPTEIASAKPPATQLPSPPITRSPSPQPSQEAVLVVPGLPHDEAIHSRMTTEQLLQSTNQNLSGIRRVLSADERDMVQQIRLYMQQSHSATIDGDLVRAHTLALKAHLLSDELAKP